MTTNSLEVEEPQVSAESPAARFDAAALGDKARMAVDVLSGILERMGLEGQVVRVAEQERIEIEIAGPDAGRLIGKKGQTLDALQFLMNKIINRDRDGRKPIVVDSEGYRVRRADSLVELALRLGEKAVRTHRTITVNPMSPHDRRIIHLALDKVPGVTTRSEGEGAFRRLLIIPEPDKL